MQKTRKASPGVIRPYEGTAVIGDEMHDIQLLKGRYPKLNPSLIAEVVYSQGPGRASIETELWRLSQLT
jgi:hypothetical protein